MPIDNDTAPTRRTSRPVAIAVHKGGRWTSICLYGPDEHRSPTEFPTREAAMVDAKRIAAALLHSDVGGAL